MSARMPTVETLRAPARRCILRQRLFLEEVVECLAGAVRAIGRGISRGRSGRTRCGCRRGVLLYRRAECVKRAFVSRIFFGDALGDWLCALELRARVEVHALFAAVQLESATRAGAVPVEARLEHHTAIRAARARDGANHARRARPDLLLVRPVFRRAFFLLLGGVRIHVTPLAILPLQRYLRGKVLS
jgi:hypothetical protein